MWGGGRGGERLCHCGAPRGAPETWRRSSSPWARELVARPQPREFAKEQKIRLLKRGGSTRCYAPSMPAGPSFLPGCGW